MLKMCVHPLCQSVITHACVQASVCAFLVGSVLSSIMCISCLRGCVPVAVSHTWLSFQEHALLLCSGVFRVVIDIDMFHMTGGTVGRQPLYKLTQSAGRCRHLIQADQEYE